MTEIEFISYHNKHIEFVKSDGSIYTGVLWHNIDYHKTGNPKTLYNFVATVNMVDWQKAQKEKNNDRMNELQSEVDLRDILSARLLNF